MLVGLCGPWAGALFLVRSPLVTMSSSFLQVTKEFGHHFVIIDDHPSNALTKSHFKRYIFSQLRQYCPFNRNHVAS